eukprot:8512495-Alexandrium_andersonii.AAC.1
MMCRARNPVTEQTSRPPVPCACAAELVAATLVVPVSLPLGQYGAPGPLARAPGRNTPGPAGAP